MTAAPTTPRRLVYRFQDELEADAGGPKEALGGKGAGLAEMTRLGIPVPPGFTITTEACLAWMKAGERFPEGLDAQVARALADVEASAGRKLGDPKAPLLVAVRSGARISMPGMMDTVLNLGLNDRTVEGLAEGAGDRRFAFDAYRRFVEMYGDVVLGVPRGRFDDAFRETKASLGDEGMADAEVPAEALAELVEKHKAIVADHTGAPFPEDVQDQLWGAIAAVFRSWRTPRAVRYRAMEDIPESWGTAVNVQAMVFGNRGETSGSGVAFTRNPSNGERALYGEFLPNAQGEDVVAGTRTPRPITVESAPPGREKESLEQSMPDAFATIRDVANRLESHFRDMQDIEFTIEDGRVYLLQTRTGKRTAEAAVRIAVAMVEEGLIDQDEALLRVDAESLEQLLHARLPAPEVLAERGIHPIASGLPASPGAALGEIVFDADEAETKAGDGHAVILVRRETSPEDIHGMKAAVGILTATGGMTSHAAVVARGLGKCCVAGVGTAEVDYEARSVRFRADDGKVHRFGAGDMLTLDGSHGRVYPGELEVEAAASLSEFDTFMGWADDRRRLRVRANADTPRGARTARSYGAQGIGLCRTEHMFFSADRLEAVRCMVLAGSEEERERWLARIEPFQQEDFLEMFEAMGGLPMTVRLLDWPLHEFLPREEADIDAVARALGIELREVRRRAETMEEVNPMLGYRGVRVGLSTPAIYRMQVRAAARAALESRRRGVPVALEIMVPVVAMPEELARMRRIVEEVLEAERGAAGPEAADLEVLIGTMIEIPRACLLADQVAEYADFFSFGTNDLTQTVWGMSRDDAGNFLPFYLDRAQEILEADPFARLDTSGVGGLMEIAVDRGRRARQELKLGICGEHGGDPRSVAFCDALGLEYVSCSPPRLPVARLAAAQATIRRERDASG
jgi:pyruvate,orthophosphate dikinase